VIRLTWALEGWAKLGGMDINFGKTLLKGRDFRELSDEEILLEGEQLLGGWMEGKHNLERPKLYDHYAIVFTALIHKIGQLEARLEALEGKK
jgi:hypothetical protein